MIARAVEFDILCKLVWFSDKVIRLLISVLHAGLNRVSVQKYEPFSVFYEDVGSLRSSVEAGLSQSERDNLKELLILKYKIFLMQRTNK